MNDFETDETAKPELYTAWPISQSRRPTKLGVIDSAVIRLLIFAEGISDELLPNRVRFIDDGKCVLIQEVQIDTKPREPLAQAFMKLRAQKGAIDQPISDRKHSLGVPRLHLGEIVAESIDRSFATESLGRIEQLSDDQVAAKSHLYHHTKLKRVHLVCSQVCRKPASYFVNVDL